MSHIEWRHDGRRLVIPIGLRLPDTGLSLEYVPGQALVDTGATNSGINIRVVRKMGLRGTGKRPLKSAHEERQTQRYIFQVGFFPDAPAGSLSLPFYFDEVNGFELNDSFDLDALIGMDILSQCDLVVDRRRKCRLTFGFGP